jgi:hypothetical protein
MSSLYTDLDCLLCYQLNLSSQREIQNVLERLDLALLPHYCDSSMSIFALFRFGCYL